LFFDFNLSMQQVVLRLIAYLFIAAVHSFTVAAAAVAMGDQGPRFDGRLRVSRGASRHPRYRGGRALLGRMDQADPFELRLGRIALHCGCGWGPSQPSSAPQRCD
jgi:hypothetical protein